MKTKILLLAGLVVTFLLTGCAAAPSKKSSIDPEIAELLARPAAICEVHDWPMSKTVVRVSCGSYPYHIDVIAEKRFPHSDCAIATGYCIPGGETERRVYVCSACIEARRNWCATAPDRAIDFIRTKQASLPELKAVLEEFIKKASQPKAGLALQEAAVKLASKPPRWTADDWGRLLELSDELSERDYLTSQATEKN